MAILLCSVIQNGCFLWGVFLDRTRILRTECSDFLRIPVRGLRWLDLIGERADERLVPLG